MRILPAILETDLQLVAQKLHIIKADGHFNQVQIDIIDGQLLPTLTITPMELIPLETSNLWFDFHLMTEEPLDYVWEIAKESKKFQTHAIQGQIERMSNQVEFLQIIKNYGWRAGLALDLETPWTSIDDNAWALMDEILLLSVPMGKQGQEFNPKIFNKIASLQKFLQKRQLEIDLIIDGGIKPQHLSALKQTQVQGVVIGSFLWSENFTQQKKQLLGGEESR